MAAKIRPFMVFRGNSPIASPDAQCVAKIYEKDGSDAVTGVDDLVLGSAGSLGYFLPEDANETSGCVVDIQTTPDADTVAATGAMQHNRFGHTATRLPDGRVLVVGGIITVMTQGEVATATCEIWDPATNTWTATGSLTTRRYGHTAELLPNGKVLVVGGSEKYYIDNWATASCELYNPATGTWSATDPLPYKTIMHTSNLLLSGNVLVCGGFTVDYPYETAAASLYNYAAGTWSSAGRMAVARSAHKSTVLLDGRVICIHGSGNPNTPDLYDPVERTWSSTSAMVSWYALSGLVVTLNDGRVISAGVASSTASESYSPGANKWTAQAPQTAYRSGCQFAANLGGRAVFFGCDGTGSTPAIMVYGPGAVWAQSVVLAPGLGCKGALLGDGRVLLCGGVSGAGAAPDGASVFTPGYPTLPPSRIVRPVYLADNSNQFWVWHLVTLGAPTTPWAGAVPTITDYVDSAGVAVTPAPTVVSIGHGLFVATPTAGDIAAGVSGRLVCAVGSALSDDAGAPEGEMTGAMFSGVTGGSSIITFTVVSSNFLLTVTFSESVIATYPLAAVSNYAASGLTITSAAILSPTVVRLVLAVEPVNGSAHTLTMVAGTAIGLTPGNYGDATPVAFTGVSVVPTVVSVLASSPTTVQVIFSKPVRQVSASNADDALHAANYTFTGLTVSTIRGVSPTEVEVTTSAQSAVPYAWAVSLAADLAGNPVTPATGSVDGYVAPVVPYGVFIFLTPHTVQVTLSVSVKVNAILLQPDAWAFIPRIASTKRIYVESVSPVSTPLTTVIILNLRDEASVSGRYDLRITGLTDYADNLVEVTI